MFTVGSTWTLNYQFSGGTTAGTSRVIDSVVQRTPFNGHSALELHRELITASTTPSIPVITNNTKFYHSEPSADGIVLHFGVISYPTLTAGASSPAAAVTTITYTPPGEDRRQLAIGGAHTMTLFGSTISVGPVTTGPLRTTVTTTTTFVGMETVTVPAGTFVTCRFDVVGVDAGGTPFSGTEWYTSGGSGVPVKTIQTGPGGGQTNELTSGTINGSAVR